jgi:hypothetical protein
VLCLKDLSLFYFIVEVHERKELSEALSKAGRGYVELCAEGVLPA